MNDFEIRTNQPIKYQICGNLRASDGFLHYKRSMELHVLIVVLKGTMYLRVGGENVIACGSDFDGADIHLSLNTPVKYAELAEKMLKRGIKEAVVDKMFFENAERFFRENV